MPICTLFEITSLLTLGEGGEGGEGAARGRGGERSEPNGDYFTLSSPLTQSNLLFCAGVQFSSDSIRAFNNGIKYSRK